jgi:hypothetical protein
MGFNGDFPRLLRFRDGGYDLAEFQISFRGGGFWVNLGRFPITGVGWDGVMRAADEVTIGYIPFLSRDRLGWNGKVDEGFFRYSSQKKDFEESVLQVVPFIDAELEIRMQRLPMAAQKNETA